MKLPAASVSMSPVQFKSWSRVSPPFSMRRPFAKVEVAEVERTEKVSTWRPPAKVEVAEVFVA